MNGNFFYFKLHMRNWNKLQSGPLICPFFWVCHCVIVPNIFLQWFLIFVSFEQEAFTRAFIDHYSRISLVLVNGQIMNRPAIANRVVHISVQLFSNEMLAKKMVEEYNLLYTLIFSLTQMVENIITPSMLQGTYTIYHKLPTSSTNFRDKIFPMIFFSQMVENIITLSMLQA